MVSGARTTRLTIDGSRRPGHLIARGSIVRGIIAALVLALVIPAPASSLEVGGYVGYHQPLQQDDATDDITVGGRARLGVSEMFRVEGEGFVVGLETGAVYRVAP